jgi:hypothetical protein
VPNCPSGYIGDNSSISTAGLACRINGGKTVDESSDNSDNSDTEGLASDYFLPGLVGGESFC